MRIGVWYIRLRNTHILGLFWWGVRIKLEYIRVLGRILSVCMRKPVVWEIITVTLQKTKPKPIPSQCINQWPISTRSRVRARFYIWHRRHHSLAEMAVISYANEIEWYLDLAAPLIDILASWFFFLVQILLYRNLNNFYALVPFQDKTRQYRSLFLLQVFDI